MLLASGWRCLRLKVRDRRLHLPRSSLGAFRRRQRFKVSGLSTNHDVLVPCSDPILGATEARSRLFVWRAATRNAPSAQPRRPSSPSTGPGATLTAGLVDTPLSGSPFLVRGLDWTRISMQESSASWEGDPGVQGASAHQAPRCGGLWPSASTFSFCGRQSLGST